MMTHGSFFTGGGVAQAMLDRCNILFAVECDPGNYSQSMRIADCHEQNIGGHMIRKPVQEADIASLPYVDWFHSSPVCKNFSNAKAGASESSIDIVTARATADYISHHLPKFVTIENVQGYIKSDAWAIIGNTLLQNGYGLRVDIINMADYGVPQTRVRMICQAVRNAPSPPKIPATHAKNPQVDMFGGGLKKWVGWYEATKDVLHKKTKYHPTRNCLEWLGEIKKEGLWLLDTKNRGFRGPAWYPPCKPSFVLTTTFSPTEFTIVESGEFYFMPTRGLAKLQSIPDSYTLPERSSDAITLIGNGIPSLYMQQVQNHFLQLYPI